MARARSRLVLLSRRGGVHCDGWPTPLVVDESLRGTVAADSYERLYASRRRPALGLPATGGRWRRPASGPRGRTRHPRLHAARRWRVAGTGPAPAGAAADRGLTYRGTASSTPRKTPGHHRVPPVRRLRGSVAARWFDSAAQPRTSTPIPLRARRRRITELKPLVTRTISRHWRRAASSATSSARRIRLNLQRRSGSDEDAPRRRATSGAHRTPMTCRHHRRSPWGLRSSDANSPARPRAVVGRGQLDES